MKARMVGLYFLPIFLLLNAPQCAQSNRYSRSSAERTAIVNMDVLKKSTLVVRLSTNARKISALQKAAKAASKEVDQNRLMRLLEKTVVATQNQNRWLMESFKSNYTFTPLLFMPDTAAVSLKNGVRQGIFVNDCLEIDPSLTLKGDFFAAYYGANDTDGYTNNEGITVIDHNLQPLKHPFPSFVGRTSMKRMFDEIFNKTTEKEHLEKLVFKFQKRLTEF